MQLVKKDNSLFATHDDGQDITGLYPGADIITVPDDTDFDIETGEISQTQPDGWEARRDLLLLKEAIQLRIGNYTDPNYRQHMLAQSTLGDETATVLVTQGAANYSFYLAAVEQINNGDAVDIVALAWPDNSALIA